MHTVIISFFPSMNHIYVFIVLTISIILAHVSWRKTQKNNRIYSCAFFFKFILYNFWRACYYRIRYGNRPSHIEKKNRFYKLYERNYDFRATYNILFRCQGNNLFDKMLFWLFGTSFFKICVRYLVLILIVSVVFFYILHFLFSRNNESQELLTSIFLFLSGETEPLSVTSHWLVLFFHYFALTIISAIVLGAITKKLIDRKPVIVFPQKIYYDPNVGNFNIWCWNRDILSLYDLQYHLEIELSFVTESARDAFAKGKDFSRCSFFVSLNSPAFSISPLQGILINSVSSQEDNGNSIVRIPDILLTSEFKGETVASSITQKYFSVPEAKQVFSCEKDEDCNIVIRIIIRVKNENGQESFHVHEYSVEDIICGVSRDLHGIGGNLYPKYWWERNLLNMQVIDEIGSEDYKYRVEAEKESSIHRLRVQECSKTFCPCYSECPLKWKYSHEHNKGAHGPLLNLSDSKK